MKKTIISMALLVLIGATGAIAQSGSKGTSIGSTINGTLPKAPDAQKVRYSCADTLCCHTQEHLLDRQAYLAYVREQG